MIYNLIVGFMIRQAKNFIHLLEALTANIVYGFPSRKMTVIGVTGTDGKTTTANLIYHILKESGKKVAVITTLGAVIGYKKYDIGFHVTTPSSFRLQKYIRTAVDDKNEYLVLEVTSHALDQNRVFGIKFDTAVLTNITHEHLDYHKTYENYANTKLKLLQKAKISVVNKDDESFKLISNSKFLISKQIQNSKHKLITYGISGNSDINPDIFSFKTKLIGEFNKLNSLAAIAVCRELGIKDDYIRKALLTFNAPIGRGEIVYDNDFKIMIDFAHTPNAFEQILPEVRKMATGRLIHVFGSAGLRDASKRPIMGKISAKYSDLIVLTSEDPRSEPVDEIMDQIQGGVHDSLFKIVDYKKGQEEKLKIEKDHKYIFRIADRKDAIEFAVKIAEKGDLVICTGKAHEKSMDYGHGEVPWNEFEVVKGTLKHKQIK